MSLNKIPPLPGGEEVGYDLRLNVGCDALKCNTINGIPYPDPNGLQYQEQTDGTAPTNINAGAFCYFQNEDDQVNVAKTNYARIEYSGGAGGTQKFNMANSAEIINCPRIATDISDSKYNNNLTVQEGSITLNLNAQRRFQEGFYFYSDRQTVPLVQTQVNCNSISLSDEQLARDTTYFYTFVADNCDLNIESGGTPPNPPFYPFRSSYLASPNLNECIQVTYVFSKQTMEWVRCQQTT